MIEVWHATIGHLDYALAKQAMIAQLRNSKFEPKPAEILGMAAEITRPAAEQRTPGEMWELVRRVASRGNPGNERYMHDKFPRAYAAAMQVGGFNHIGLADHYRELPFLRRDFLRFYDEMTERDEDRAKVGLEQLTEAENVLLGGLKLLGEK